eukprot:38180-Eustigmatos_ZCMA.PRE.1
MLWMWHRREESGSPNVTTAARLSTLAFKAAVIEAETHRHSLQLHPYSVIRTAGHDITQGEGLRDAHHYYS